MSDTRYPASGSVGTTRSLSSTLRRALIVGDHGRSATARRRLRAERSPRRPHKGRSVAAPWIRSPFSVFQTFTPPATRATLGIRVTSLFYSERGVDSGRAELCRGASRPWVRVTGNRPGCYPPSSRSLRLRSTQPCQRTIREAPAISDHSWCSQLHPTPSRWHWCSSRESRSKSNYERLVSSLT